MADEIEENPEHPALKGFDSTWEYTKYVGKSFLKTALKGAVIGGLALGALALIPAAPLGLLGSAVSFITGGAIAPAMGTAAVLGGAGYGAMFGGVAGAAIGLAKGFGGAEEAVEEEREARVSRAMRAQQLAANQEMMAMNMDRMRAAAQGMGGGVSPSHGLPNMGPEAGITMNA